VNRTLAIGAVGLVLVLIVGCFALLLCDKTVPEWLSIITASGFSSVVSVIATLKVTAPK